MIFLTEHDQKLVEEFKQFSEQEIFPVLNKLEEDENLCKSIYSTMAENGYFLLTCPKDCGGRGFNFLLYYEILKIIARADAGLALAISVTNMIAETIHKFGSTPQKKKYLSLLRKCDAPLAFAVTEEKVGSDAKNVSTTYVKKGAHYVLNGEKHLITNADNAPYILVLAKEKGKKNLSMFLVEREEIRLIKQEKKLGLLTAHLVDIWLKDSIGHPLGSIGKGFSIAMDALDSGRLGIAAQSIGIAQAAFEKAVSYSKKRKQFGCAICEHQAIAFKLADMHIKISAAEMLLYKAACHKDMNLPCTLEASEAKVFASEMCNEVTYEAMQICGGRSYTKDFPFEKYFRDARATTLYEGTSEIQRLIIAKSILKD